MLKKSNKKFWNKEYDRPEHLTMSDEPASDLVSFARWAERNSEWYPFPKGGLVVDLGCGNGRNIIHMSKQYEMNGYGVDISDTGIAEAMKAKGKLPIILKVGSIANKLPFENESVDVVLDMMTSHFLNKEEREVLLLEIVQILKPYGWFFFKTFVLDGDVNAKRLLRENPSDEEGTYVHPKIGVPEYVGTEESLHSSLEKHFKIHKMLKSYKHVTKDGKPYKRRTISAYLEKLG